MNIRLCRSKFVVSAVGIFEVVRYPGRYAVSIQVIDFMDTYAQKKFGKGNYRKELMEKPECLTPVPRRYGRYGIGEDEDMESIKSHVKEYNSSCVPVLV
jgi:hypothetical protein